MVACRMPLGWIAHGDGTEGQAPAVTLAFDTSGPWVAAALVRGSEVVAARAEAMERGQTERLMPLLQELCPDLERVTLLACGRGPGNFTGVRVAVATARGLALALGRPALGVTLFEAAALDAPRPRLVALDARRGELYAQRLGLRLRRPQLAEADAASLPPAPALPPLTQAEAPESGEEPPALWPAGTLPPLDGCAAVIADKGARAAFEAAGATLPAARWLPLPEPAQLAINIARIAATRPPAEGERPAPLYLRAADAKPPREPPPAILP